MDYSFPFPHERLICLISSLVACVTFYNRPASTNLATSINIGNWTLRVASFFNQTLSQFLALRRCNDASMFCLELHGQDSHGLRTKPVNLSNLSYLILSMLWYG